MKGRKVEVISGRIWDLGSRKENVTSARRKLRNRGYKNIPTKVDFSRVNKQELKFSVRRKMK